MKKLMSLALAALFILSLSVQGVFAIFDNKASRYENPVSPAYMPYAAPVIDGSTAADEGWGDAVAVDETNCIPTLSERVYSYPSASVRFAFDKDNLYISAQITDDDFCYCTGENTEVVYDIVYSGYKDMDFLDWDGDVFALALDQGDELISVAGRSQRSDLSAWICFGLFEDGHVGERRTLYNPEDITPEVTVSGARTETGWRFEAALPWEAVSDTLDASSYGVVDFDYEKMTANGAVNRGCILLCDRVDDPEIEEICCDNIFATLSEYTMPGISTEYVWTPSIGAYGQSL